MQVLWADFSFENKKNVICGIFYRQYNSTEVITGGYLINDYRIVYQ